MVRGLLTLGAAQGTSLTIAAEGPDATASLDAIEQLLSDRFGEDE